VAFAAAVPATAQAAIGFVAASTAQTATAGATSLSLAAPTGVAAGNIEIATLSLQGTSSVTPPSGWNKIIDTQLGTSLRQASFWHVAGSAEGTTSWTISTKTPAAGGIAAYSGVDTTTIVDAASATTGTSGLSATIPSVTDTFSGDQVLGAGSFNNQGTLSAGTGTTSRYTSKVATTNGPALLLQDATQSTAGATSSQTVTDSSAATAWIGQAITLKSAAAAGVLSVQAGASPSFSANLDTGDQTLTYTVSLTTNASVSPAPGWNETITSTQFTASTHTLPASAATIQAAPSAVCNSSQANCSAPTNSVTYPVNVPAGSGPPTAVKFFNAAASTGAGLFTVTPTVSVTVPQNSFAGSYASTVTLAIASGP
jgi:hypothetical protein